MPAHRVPPRRVGTGSVLRRDLPASIVVFLVALPLCVGVAVASDVPPELGLLTGIVGGLIVGVLPGSSLQVSGPAAGLTVLVAEVVHRNGPAGLAVIVLGTGLAQIALGLCRLGRWFRAISVSVVEGMLAGIGVVIIAGQLYPMAAAAAPAAGWAKVTGLPGLFWHLPSSTNGRAALGVGLATLSVIALHAHLPRRLRVFPAPLVAVAVAATLVHATGLPVRTLHIGDLASAVHPLHPDAWHTALTPSILGSIAVFTLVASAESLFSAAAVDRLHDGPRTDYDRELVAQGVGNTVCGLLGALPLTAVIVRSSANVSAGARTKASRVLHGAWLLAFTLLFPAVLRLMPLPALAAILVHAGWKLLPLRRWRPLWRERRGEALVLAATMSVIVVRSLFEGVLVGLALAVLKTAWETSHVAVHVHDGPPDAPLRVRIEGSATFLRLPRILDELEALPPHRPVALDLSGLRHRDHACELALQQWQARHDRFALTTDGSRPSQSLARTGNR